MAVIPADHLIAALLGFAETPIPVVFRECLDPRSHGQQPDDHLHTYGPKKA